MQIHFQILEIFRYIHLQEAEARPEYPSLRDCALNILASVSVL